MRKTKRVQRSEPRDVKERFAQPHNRKGGNNKFYKGFGKFVGSLKKSADKYCVEQPQDQQYKGEIDM